MYGLISKLDHVTNGKVNDLLLELETRCGLKGIQSSPFPHFTWQVTEGYDLPRLKESLTSICFEVEPFAVRTTGIGIFTGEKPTIYLSIFKNKPLIQLHDLLWQATQSLRLDPSPYYAPNQWVPHITLGYNDVRPDNIGCVMEKLAFQSFDWTVEIDNLIYISQIVGEKAETIQFQFHHEG
jgi:2'-5' RNA ligase